MLANKILMSKKATPEAKKPRTRTEWTEGEEAVLVAMVEAYGVGHWEKISREMEESHFLRSAKKCADKWRAISHQVRQDQLPAPPPSVAAAADSSEGSRSDDDDDDETLAAPTAKKKASEPKPVPAESPAPPQAADAATAGTPSTPATTAKGGKKKRPMREETIKQVLNILGDEGAIAESVPGAAEGRVNMTEIAERLAKAKEEKQKRKEEEKKGRDATEAKLVATSDLLATSIKDMTELFKMYIAARIGGQAAQPSAAPKL